MKGIDIFCASQAATAIRSTMEEITAAASSSSYSAIQLGGGGGGGGGGRAIDRFNPIITDSRRRTAPVPKPPAPNAGGVGKTKKDKSKSSKSNINKKKNPRKPAAGEESGGGGGAWRCTKPGGFITPQSSSRYLLNENEDNKDYFLDVLSDFDPILKLDDPNNHIKNLQQLSDQSGSSHTPLPPLHSSSPLPPSGSTDQVVVVLRVSLHCRGCERKMRKHLSRMQGVSSFNIDFAAKKVTVVGDVTPLGVLASISKVKNAQLWSPAVAGSSIPAAASLSNSSSKTAKPAMATPTTNENMENISRNIQLISMN